MSATIDAGIDAAAQEGAKRNVADQPNPDRFAKPRPELVDCLSLRDVALRAVAELPIAADRDMPVLHQEVVRRRQLVHTLERGHRRRDVLIGQVRGQRRRIGSRREGRIGEERLRLGREGESVRVGCVEEGLLAETIARDQQPASWLVPDRECEHAAQATDALHAVFAIRIENDLAVRMAPEAMAARFELRSKLQEVVDFAVEREPDLTVGRRHRLGAGLAQVDDGQPAMTQAGMIPRPDARSVRSAVGNQIAHALHEGCRHRALRHVVDPAGNATHGSVPPSRMHGIGVCSSTAIRQN